ncbi:D-threo-aldose 1-dehydrogenase [Paenibacillus cellulosilyticus]|uniref:D-threo-aldose 1-dehydrogenase n=1 Tax=Paenibacillus cellulosilyticus TaxID=375489 RepID=A0A2V2YWJ9_9BACL|nr:aldo/keto reductase [Paenibacillus cellulosilyticus]PWW03169.1 D-threo-aldose 1-dehydrogenase [Paenibacillus cellulosilyticus]QKS43664.1 aldo/keto reductase [Paenibacillus cellulosilyticus]
MSNHLLSKRPLGSTGLLVTPLCIGAAPLGDMPETFQYGVPEEQALTTLRTAFESSINFLDTAAAYGNGESERRIGKAIQANGGLPAGYVLATKADRDLTTGDFSGEQIKRSIEGSLERLGLDRLQYVYIHDPEHTTFENIMGPGGALEVLRSFQDQRVIDNIGISGGPIDMLIRYVETGAFSAVETHNRYTLLNRCAEPLLEIASRMGVAVVNGAPYGSGILAKGPDAYARYAYSEAPPIVIERARAFAKVCQEYDVPLAAAALQFSLRDPRIASTVIGMTKPERVAQTIELANYPIPAELWPALDAFGYDTTDPEATRFNPAE